MRKKLVGLVTVLPFAGRMSGGTVFYHEVAKRFAQAGYKVDIIVKPTKKRLVQNFSVDGVNYVRKGSFDDADLILLHSASLKANPPASQFSQPVLYILHSWTDLIKDDLDNLSTKDYLISNSRNIFEKVSDYKTNHKIIYPICKDIYRKKSTKRRVILGEHYTAVGSPAVKNLELFYSLAARNRQKKFIHVKGGYGVFSAQENPGNVRLVFNTADLYPIYKETRTLIVPSYSETFSLVAREAGLLGIPVVCSDLPGLRENLGKTGFYADPRDISSFEKHLRRLEDPVYYEQVSKKIQGHCRQAEYANLRKLDKLIESL